MPTRAIISTLTLACGLALGACASDKVATASDGSQTVTMKVTGMACPNCAKEIEHHLAEVPGVKSAAVDFNRQMATVAYKPGVAADRAALKAAVEDWRVHHFGAETDANCLNPEKREEIKKSGG